MVSRNSYEDQICEILAKMWVKITIGLKVEKFQQFCEYRRMGSIVLQTE